MEGTRSSSRSFIRIRIQESTARLVHVAGSQIVEPKVSIELFTTVEIIVRRSASSRDERAEGVIIVRVGDRRGVVRELPHGTVAVVTIEAQWSTGYSLTDQIVAISKLFDDVSVH